MMRGCRLIIAVVVVVAALCVSSVYPQCFSTNDAIPRNVRHNHAGITDFGVELYRQLDPAESRENFFFSPFSIWSALSLAYLGSAKNTEAQLKDALRATDKMNTLRTLNSFKMIARQRDIPDAKFTYKDANRVYVDETFPLRQCIRDHLHDLLETVNFRDAKGSAKVINDFISRTTEGKLTNVVSSGALADAVLALVNAAYFKGTWAKQFEVNDTKSRYFYPISPNSPPEEVLMMRQQTKMRYGESTELGAHVLELPYSGDVISMFLLLPTTEGEAGWRRMVGSSLTGATLNQAISRTNTREQLVDLLLPKFSLETTLNEKLKQSLVAMGVTDIFNSRYADMSGFVTGGGISVSKIIHKALVEVSEEGTVAAAATVVVFVFRVTSIDSPRIIQFHCDRPFLFVIVDNQNKNVLFMGAHKKPSTT